MTPRAARSIVMSRVFFLAVLALGGWFLWERRDQFEQVSLVSWPMLIALSLVTPMLLSLGTWYLLGVQVPGFIDEIAIQIDAILASFSGAAE